MADSTITTCVDQRVRRMRRRLSTPHERSMGSLQVLTCNPLPTSLSALDLSSASPTLALASLRILVLSHLAELEAHLSETEESVSSSIRSKKDATVAEACVWANDALEMLRGIRDDVKSHLPELPFDNASVEGFVQSYMHEIPGLDSVRNRLQDFPSIRSHLPDSPLADMRSCIDSVRSYLPEMPADMHHPLTYLPTLSCRLQSLHTHLSSVQAIAEHQLPSAPSYSEISRLLDNLSSPTLLSSTLQRSAHKLEKPMKGVAQEIAQAIKRSLDGSRLVTYVDLPPAWQNNPFVTHGYRFIPLHKWHLLLLSLFALHNETINIHTHMIPLLHTLLRHIPYLGHTPSAADTPETCFVAFASFCLFSSVLWHTMSGCAHLGGMELCARVDYVGIGWLISATIGTFVYYGFRDHSTIANAYLSLCLLTGILGNIFPFMAWFNDRRYKMWRVCFFLTMAFTGLAPAVHLAYFCTLPRMLAFVGHLVPSLLSYAVGLVFYVSHFPECYLNTKSTLSRWTDWLGGGSHAIWHAFIVLAIYQHRQAMRLMRNDVLY